MQAAAVVPLNTTGLLFHQQRNEWSSRITLFQLVSGKSAPADALAHSSQKCVQQPKRAFALRLLRAAASLTLLATSTLTRSATVADSTRENAWATRKCNNNKLQQHQECWVESPANRQDLQRGENSSTAVSGSAGARHASCWVVQTKNTFMDTNITNPQLLLTYVFVYIYVASVKRRHNETQARRANQHRQRDNQGAG